ncbi:Kelch motif-containing protein [Actinacidiphila yanglinensis]|uniref:Kelch motif-containing protein n=1 Tax=Actinacidiphila yanglinensis TaxID=310779 RepID=A0A1H5S788_9ACTN|nr:carboxypeptidase regulatory-like domain-containing protein [Actinacidiphila yanglinensis]SEF46270.1 Kelch motif-containing protein [Actinacidiphila yanglinensis]
MKHTSLSRRLITLLTAGVVAAGMSVAAAGTARAAPAPSTSPAATASKATSAQHRTAGAATPKSSPAQQKTSATAGSQGTGYAAACGTAKGARAFSCQALKRTGVVEPKAVGTDAAPAGYGPSDIQSAYDLPSTTASPTVAIVDAFDDPKAESDLAVYRAQFGLPACTTANGCFTKVDQNGGTDYPPAPPAGDDWPSEISLDLDAVSAACPACHILFVEADTDANGDSLPTAVETARTMGAKYISMSWGGSEDGTENAADEQYFDHPGIVYTASSGDNGYEAGTIYPSTSQYVVSVGGTSLQRVSGSARGWAESAWDGAGSGCSVDVTKPGRQSGISACDTRADTDISAVADPSTGLAIYNSDTDSGWDVFGGTSLSAPLVASMYALAGTPVPGTNPANYPYDDPNRASDLNDVTQGSNGACTPSELCQSGTGWDGPTGLGTPHGVGALTTGPHGDIKGQVTDAGTGKPLSGVKVAVQEGGYVATTDADGDYDMAVPPGSYDLTATKYGYGDKGVTDISVTADSVATENVAMTAEPTHTVSGTVTDGSGHGWPMRAKITIDGYPNGPVYSDPYTGHYSVTLPAGEDYTLHVASADLPGYSGQDATVAVDDADVSKDLALKVDASTCTAPGYAYEEAGTTEAFTGWSGTTTHDGWTVTDGVGNGQTWGFDNVGGWDAPPGGDQYFADVDSNYYGEDGKQDTSLVSPVIDLTGRTSPEIGFDSTYIGFPDQTGSVDLSLDGGTTWSTVFQPYSVNPGHIDVPIPQAAGQSDVRVRFHFTGSWSRRWELDDVLVGSRTCAPQTGGLVAGTVTDANTGDALNGAKVTSGSDATQAGVTVATPDDAGLGDGYYWLFSSHTGGTPFTVADGKYTSTQASVNVPADGVRHRNFALDAGHLTVAQQSVSTSQELGAAKSKSVTFGNDGSAPVHVSIDEDDAGFTAMGAAPGATIPSGAPAMVLKTKASIAAPTATSGSTASGPATAGPVLRDSAAAAAGPWTSVADYPEAVMDEAVADHGGKIYVAGGFNGDYDTQDAYVYDPAVGSWSAIAPLPEPLEASSAAFVGDTLYVAGGWNVLSDDSTHTYAYHPATDTWTRVADLPTGAAAGGTAVVDGKLYVIAGCTSGQCLPATSAVYSYDPGSDSWSAEPDYPASVAFTACAGVDAKVVCAGGIGGSTLASTYTYTPGASGWTKGSDLPTDVWGASTASANGQLEVMGGIVNDGKDVTNQGFAYDPDTDAWTDLPNSNSATYRGGAACGIYKIGGSGPAGPVPVAENLPGYDQCGSDVSWLSESTTGFDVAPGQTVAVQVTTDSSTVSQPGTFQGNLVIDTDSPYGSAQPVVVTMQVTPPKTWGKVTGTVTDSGGTPLGGATVAICTMYDTGTGRCGPQTYTLKTDGHGAYQLWLDKGFNPLEIIAAKDGYTPLLKIAKITKGGTTAVDFALNANSAFTVAKTQDYLTAHVHSSTG